MKHITYKISSAMIASQLFVTNAFAQLKPAECAGGIECSQGTDVQSFRALVIKYVTLVLDFVTLIALIYVIIAGIRLIVSGGDEGEKDKAKKTIIYVIIGILVVLFARVIVTFFSTINQTGSL